MNRNMKRILIITNDARSTYNFRKEIIVSLIKQEYKVIMTCPKDENIKFFTEIGVQFIPNSLNRHSMNPIKELKLLKEYKKIIKETNPDLILSFTVKPNTYGAIAASKYDIPFLSNITGLGNGLQDNDFKSKIILYLYKIAFNKTNIVFFQNTDNYEFMNTKLKIDDKSIILPGSGVNLKEFVPLQYPKNDKIKILYFGRLMKSKGIYEYLEAIKIINEKSNKYEFHFVGFFDDKDVEKKFEQSLSKNSNVFHHNYTKNISKFIEKSDAVILPSHHEGMSNSLLESAASSRPLLASNIPGCREIINDGISGYLFNVNDANEIANKIEMFAKLDFDTRKKMGKASRKKVEEEFDRNKIVDQYMKQIHKIIGGNYEGIKN